MATPPPHKNSKRDYAEVEKSPDIHQKLNDTEERLKGLILSTYENFQEKIVNLLHEGNAASFVSLKEMFLDKTKELMQKISSMNEECVKSTTVITTSQKDISARLNDLEQEKFNNSIEISGINQRTMNSQKSSREIASQILSIYGIDKYETAYKRQVTVKSEKVNLLVVKFSSYKEKMEALNKKRTVDIGKSCQVYFNHSLTSLNRSIFMRTRIAAKSLNQKVIISHGRVFIKHQDDKFGTRVRSHEDVDKLIADGGISL